MSERTGNQIRQQFIDFFVERGHTFVPSSSLVPGGDQTLLFTNSGMVQFKDVFLGTDKRPYTRAANSQKCMRVSGKHNDLEDVGFDDTHHTFFEMLGNWSFGDYYKEEAIAWAWELLTEVWGLPKERLWATCFEDEHGEIPRDDEAANIWRAQPGFDPSHVLFFGRKDNFWEMADTGPCGPNSEIHIDLGPEFCNMQHVPGHECRVNGDCARFLELWNLVFMQYNRLDAHHLEPLPAKHVDTGMGLERIVAVLQGKTSNYRTDLLWPLIETVQRLTGHSDEEREAHFSPYRVIADHARAATFLIADGVVPGNVGRNYVSRMLIRRASRFGRKLGLEEPFLAEVARTVVAYYGQAYPELEQHADTIYRYLTREEERFQRTLESGLAHLEGVFQQMESQGERILPGQEAFRLYTTYGLPMEITRDIARERGLEVDEQGFRQAMEEHRLKSGAGQAMGPLGGEEVEVYRQLVQELQASGKLGPDGVAYDPYSRLEVEGEVLALVCEGQAVDVAAEGDRVAVLLPETCFYVEAGGQVSDTGTIRSDSDDWEIRVEDTRKPAAGAIVHLGTVVCGTPRVGDHAIAQVDALRRRDIMRNHTATHLLHAELRAVLGESARQAGSLVAPDRLRFDFSHADPLTPEQLRRIEAGVNRAILMSYPVQARIKAREEAIAEGAMALFGEKYGDTVRTIAIGRPEEPYSLELCGGTHLSNTNDIGIFLIVSESSVSQNTRRIEAVTGRAAYALVRRRFDALERAADLLSSAPEEIPDRLAALQEELSTARKQIAALRRDLAKAAFDEHLHAPPRVAGVPVLALTIPNVDDSTLREMADRFRQKHSSGVVVLATVNNERPILVAAITEDLVSRGLHAGQLARHVAQQLGGGGGGKPTLAQAGGRDASRLESALAGVAQWVEAHLN